MTTDKTLLPCPFCGGEAERIDFDVGSGDNEGGSCIACTKCQASGPVEFGYKENFVSNWNRRELCRAAPAGGRPYGGDPAEPRDDSDRYDSAPAGGDGCTESNCERCNTAQHARGGMRHAGIGTYPSAPAGGDPVAFVEMVEDEWRLSVLKSAPCDSQTIMRHGAHLYLQPKDSAPAGSGEVDGWKKWPIINRLQMQANDCEDAADMESDAVIMPLQLKALATDLREAAALLRKLQQGEGYVMVPRDSAKMVTHVCSEWIDLFRDAPGIEKYERYSYEPAVEELRDEYAAIAASKGQEGGNG